MAARPMLSPVGLVRDTSSAFAAIEPVALVVTECVTVTTAMRKNELWSHSSVAAILGGPLSARTTLAESGATVPPEDDLSASRSLSAATQFDHWLGIATGQATDVPNSASHPVPAGWGFGRRPERRRADDPLIGGLTALRNELKGCTDIRQLDAPAIAGPFLQVIRSPLTSATITSLALIAITKFLSYGIIGPTATRAKSAVHEIAIALSRCQVGGPDSAADEVVTLRVLRLMEAVVTGPVGRLLTDAGICALFENGLRLCCQTRLSGVIRRGAEMAMVAMCQVVFERLKTIESVDGNESIDEGLTIDLAQAAPHRLAVADTRAMRTSSSGSTAEPSRPSSRLSRHSDPGGEPDESEMKPYGLAAIVAIFRQLVHLVGPRPDGGKEDSLRVTALRMVDVTIEVAGSAIGDIPQLAVISRNELCRSLLMLVRSGGGVVVDEALRVMSKLVTVSRTVLRLQQEAFITHLISELFPVGEIGAETGIDSTLSEGIPTELDGIEPRRRNDVDPSDRAPGWRRFRSGFGGGSGVSVETLVETVTGLVRMPGYAAELYLNYDSAADRADVCQAMVGLLCRLSLPDVAETTTANVPPLCQDALLGLIQAMADRASAADRTAPKSDIDVLAVQKQVATKRAIKEGAVLFNVRPADGLDFLVAAGVVPAKDDATAVARILRHPPFNKTVVGTFLAKEQNEPILAAYIDLFDFAGMRLDQAVRVLLGSFRLPGESALIERILEAFAKAYVEREKPADVASADAAYVLTYAIIMLNTDQHNPNASAAQRPMTFDQFRRNLVGVNDGVDFATSFLELMFHAIREDEIILPDEHGGSVAAVRHRWASLVARADEAGPVRLCSRDDAAVLDGEIFAASWKPIVAALSCVFMSATDQTVFYRVVLGLHHCAKLAVRFGVPDALDRLICSLGRISGLGTDRRLSTALNTVVRVGAEQEDDDRPVETVMVSETAVRFGRSFRAQLSMVLLFRTVSGNEGRIRDGWRTVGRVVTNLFENALVNSPAMLIPSSWAEQVPLLPQARPAHAIDRPSVTAPKQADAWLSTFTSYVARLAADQPPEPSEQEIELTMATVACVESCRIEGVFSRIAGIATNSTSVDAVVPIVDAFLATLSPETESDQTDSERRASSESGRHSGLPDRASVRQSVQSGRPAGYDPCRMFVLELCTAVALASDHAMAAVGGTVADALLAQLRAGGDDVTVGRTAFYLLALLQHAGEFEFIRGPLILHSIARLGPSLPRTAPLLVAGFKLVAGSKSGYRAGLVASPDFWQVLSKVYSFPDVASSVIDLVSSLVPEPGTGTVSADSFSRQLVLLDQIADRAGDSSAIRSVGSTVGPVQHGLDAVSVIFRLTASVGPLTAQSQLEPAAAWRAYWLPVLQVLTKQCQSRSRAVRAAALQALGRALFLPDLVPSKDSEHGHDAWTAVFSDALLPMVGRLLRPELFQLDPGGMALTRVEAARLLCKAFLHHLSALAEWKPDDVVDNVGLVPLWAHILALLDRLMHSGQGDNVREAVGESVKNIMLVMSASGFLELPIQPDGETKDELASQIPKSAGVTDTAGWPQSGTTDQTLLVPAVSISPTSAPAITTEPTSLGARLWDRSVVGVGSFLPDLLPDLFPSAVDGDSGFRMKMHSQPAPAFWRASEPTSPLPSASSFVSAEMVSRSEVLAERSP